MTHKQVAVLSAMLAFAAGCATDMIQVSGRVLTSGSAIQSGKRTAVSSFQRDDYIIQLTDFTWSNPSNDGGTHRVAFDWYHDDKLVSKTPPRYLKFNQSPYTLYTKRAAATLGSGKFRVETIVDDSVVASNSFDIAP